MTTEERKLKNREYQRKWFDKNRTTQNARVRANHERVKKENRENILEYLSTHPCVDCGEDNPIVLEFDHIEDKTRTISSMLGRGYSWKTISKEIEKCEIRCANCHRIKTSNQFGWYRSI